MVSMDCCWWCYEELRSVTIPFHQDDDEWNLSNAWKPQNSGCVGCDESDDDSETCGAMSALW